MMTERIEQMIGEIHDMLVEHMNEDDASVILSKVRGLSESSEYEGYSQGYNDRQDEFDAGYDEDYV